jgi:hypothetical protein
MRPQRRLRRRAVEASPLTMRPQRRLRRRAVEASPLTTRFGTRPATHDDASISRIRLICEFDLDTPIG